MNKTIMSFLFATALTGATGSAFAEGSLSYNIAVTNNYVWRGQTQTQKDAAVQGGIDYTNGTFYAGAWASNVDFGTKANAEVDLYAGVKPSVGSWSFDFGAIYYAYPKDDGSNFGELKAAVSHPLGKGTIGAALFTNWEKLENPYYEINASYPLTEKWSASGALGKYEASSGEYTTWNAGLGYAFNQTTAVDVRYWDTGDHHLGQASRRNPYKEQIAVTLKAAF